MNMKSPTGDAGGVSPLEQIEDGTFLVRQATGDPLPLAVVSVKRTPPGARGKNAASAVEWWAVHPSEFVYVNMSLTQGLNHVDLMFTYADAHMVDAGDKAPFKDFAHGQLGLDPTNGPHPVYWTHNVTNGLS